MVGLFQTHNVPKKALFFGTKPIQPTLGCINDVANIRDFLSTLYGFREVYKAHYYYLTIVLKSFILIGRYGCFDRRSR